MDPIYEAYANSRLSFSMQNFEEIFKDVVKEVDVKFKKGKRSLIDFAMSTPIGNKVRFTTFNSKSPSITVLVDEHTGSIELMFSGAVSGISDISLKGKFKVSKAMDSAEGYDEFENKLKKMLTDSYKKWWPKFEAYRNNYSNYVAQTGNMT